MAYQLPNGFELGAIQLNVSDLERSLQFYQHTIGFSVLNRTGNSAALTVDGVHTFLVLHEPAEVQILPKQSTAGLYHFAILLPDRKDLGRALRHFIKEGISHGSADHLVSEAIYLWDPDQNGIEIYVDRPSHTWSRTAGDEVEMTTMPMDTASLITEAGEGVWGKLPPNSKLGHIHLHVTDLLAAADFYHKSLGFDITASDLTYAGVLFLAANGYHHHIAINTWAGKGASLPPKNAVGVSFIQ